MKGFKKKKIINIARELISKEGYANVSVRKIAKKAGVSDGTLYYHFPKGKLDILMNLMKLFEDDLQLKKILPDGEITEEELRAFFLHYLDMTRKKRAFLIAMEIELLSKPDFYLTFADQFINEKEMEPFIKIFEKIAGKELSKSLFTKIISVWKVLIHHHIFLRNLYGSDEDFMNIIITITQAMIDI